MGGFRKEFHLFFVPRKSFLCEKTLQVCLVQYLHNHVWPSTSKMAYFTFVNPCWLQDLGVFGTFTNVDEFCLDLIPFDSDVLSMEMELSFKVRMQFRCLVSFYELKDLLSFSFKFRSVFWMMTGQACIMQPSLWWLYRHFTALFPISKGREDVLRWVLLISTFCPSVGWLAVSHFGWVLYSEFIPSSLKLSHWSTYDLEDMYTY